MLWVGFESGTLVLCSVPSSVKNQLKYNWFFWMHRFLGCRCGKFCVRHCLPVLVAVFQFPVGLLSTVLVHLVETERVFSSSGIFNIWPLCN